MIKTHMMNPILLAGGLCLACAVFAGQPAAPQATTKESAGDSPARLDEQLRLDERRRLRGVLENSHKAYPEGEQVQQRRRQMFDRMEERLNADVSSGGVGSISRREAELRHPRAARYFDQIDVNGDGILTLDEIRAAPELLQAN